MIFCAKPNSPAALLGTVVALNFKREEAHHGRRPVPLTQTEKDKATVSYGFYLEEAARESGIDFNHRAPVLDEKPRLVDLKKPSVFWD